MPATVPRGIPKKIFEEPGLAESSAGSEGTEYCSSFASAGAQAAGTLPDRQSLDTDATVVRESFTARACSLSHAVDVKRGLAANRQRQAQQRLQQLSGERQMPRTHSVRTPTLHAPTESH
jgi:hypothetical protein